MKSESQFANVAALLGDPARAAMVSALMAGQALTARELAHEAGITPQTASFHLTKLADANIVVVQAEGRHRYFGLASPAVADAVRALARIAAPVALKRVPRMSDEFRLARTCYDHLAGRVAVAMAEALSAHGLIEKAGDDFELKPKGERMLGDFGIDVAAARARKRHFARACLDWSERRRHLAGALGAALLARYEDLDWVVRTPGDRSVAMTQAGFQGFDDTFGADTQALRRALTD